MRLDSEAYTWSLAGEMKRGRAGHNVVRFKNDFYVFGGTGRGANAKNGYMRTNKCIHNARKITCSMIGTENFDNYNEYPELILIPDGYCSKDKIKNK